MGGVQHDPLLTHVVVNDIGMGSVGNTGLYKGPLVYA